MTRASRDLGFDGRVTTYMTQWLVATLCALAYACSAAAPARTAGSNVRAPSEPVRSASASNAIPGAAPGASAPGAVAAGTPAGSPGLPGEVARRRDAVSVDDCPGTLTQDAVTLLQSPASVPGATRWLYPYDKTVFPRGITAPVLQWDTPASQAIYLHLRSALFEYRGCFAGTNAASFAIPQTAWDSAGEQSLGGAADPLQIEVTLLRAGRALRLPTVSISFALATLKGAVYYSTYNSAIANARGILSGVIMRVLPKQPQPEVFVSAPVQNGDCVGCHTVSADGGRMLVASHNDSTLGIAGEFGSTEAPGYLYDLKAAGARTQPPPLQSNLKRTGFAALYPDGTRYLGQGAIMEGPTPGGTLFPIVTNVWGSFGPETSKLYDANTGVEIPNSGIIDYAYMPAFSGDGTLLVFNPIDQSGDPGHTLAVMEFDRSRDKLSQLRTVYKHAAQYPSWPCFLPEVVENAAQSGEGRNKRIIFALGEVQDFATQDAFLDPSAGGPHPSDLWWLDVGSGKATALALANGQAETGNTYLPYGERDAHKNYYPTVSPVAAGGYFWLFFTSKRNYGNQMVSERAEDHPEAKKIWVSAIDVDAPAGADPSHPAFLLAGQELASGNTRAFAALDACRVEGDSCDSGLDCCCGFCLGNACACRTTQVLCARTDERCATAADCCDKTEVCIGGFCGVRGPD